MGGLGIQPNISKGGYFNQCDEYISNIMATDVIEAMQDIHLILM